jgi:CDP-diacylglycerol---glycerol-3-phosphate 3-phosphatidyltransferase
MLAGITNELDRISPRFDIHARQIRIIKTPSDFYDTLKSKISNAKSRIYLSTLYIGKTEHELIATLREALQKNPQLKVSILTDALRGTREAPKQSCASLLAPLIAEFGSDRVDIRMFHTPNLTGLRKKVVPQRINEGWGLQHMKLYGVDDEIIMSGANLSTDYFTNRQDRYHLFSSAAITNYFERVFNAACSISYQILPSDTEAGFEMVWPDSNPAPSPLHNPSAYRSKATTVLNEIISSSNQQIEKTPSTATSVYPLLQFTPILTPDTSTELPVLKHILRSLSQPPLVGSSWTFTAGYFNMTPEIQSLLLSSRASRATVIAASPQANGFYGSKGVSGMLPDAYTLMARRFVAAASTAISRGGAQDVQLREWRRGTVGEPNGWTYHAKGLWVTLPSTASNASSDVSNEEPGPSLTIVGSSNYTKRSYSLDLEANVAVVTRDPDLQQRLRQEEQWLGEYAKPVAAEEFERIERRVGLHVRLAMLIVKVLGGAL